MTIPTKFPPALPLLALCGLALSGCATPYERCLAPIAEDLSTLQVLIAETETGLARGYVYRTEPRPVTVGINYCVGGYGSNTGLSLCNDGWNDVVQVPVAIDSVTERRKLEELRAREAKLQAALPEAQRACAARYGG